MATPQERQAAEEARKFYELKQRVVKYYQANGVPEKMDQVLNSMFYDDPVDVYGYLSQYFSDLASPPSISKVKSREVLDSRGQPAVQTEVYCMIRNAEVLVATSTASNYSYTNDAAKVEEKEEEDSWRQESITEAIHILNGELSEKLTGKNPSQLEELDNIGSEVIQRLRDEEAEKIAVEKAEEAASAEGESPRKGEDEKAGKKAPPSPKKSKSTGNRGRRSKTGKSAAATIVPDEPREVFLKGSNSLSALSQALAIAGAKVNKIPVYQHLSQLKSGEELKKFWLPLPVVSLMQTGKACTGKLRCVKDFMVCPSPTMPRKDAVKHISAIYQYLSNCLYNKFGAKQVNIKNTNDVGALNPPFDKVEQGLDAIQEAITHQGLTPVTDFTVILNCSAQEIFDFEKGKYETCVGAFKSPEDVCDYWTDLVNRYPIVNGLIDPLRKSDIEAWSKLCEKISSKCYIIGDFIYHRPGRLKDEELLSDVKTSGIVFRLEQMNTITDIMKCAKKMEEASNQIIISTCRGETTDTFLTDLAVGLGAKFLMVGAPCRGERVAKLNRLAQIEDLLGVSDGVEILGEHSYPDLTAPTPADVQIPEEDESGEKTENVVGDEVQQ